LAALRPRARRIAELDGERYLVSMLGERASWPHNVRAAGARAHIPGDRHASVEAFGEVAPRIHVFRITPRDSGH
jgi:hypothetical protein